jgi:hypothetical protein
LDEALILAAGPRFDLMCPDPGLTLPSFILIFFAQILMQRKHFIKKTRACEREKT